MFDFEISEQTREKLREPLGKLISDSDLKTLKGRKIVVGDKVALSFLEQNLEPDVLIVDYTVERKEISEKPYAARHKKDT